MGVAGAEPLYVVALDPEQARVIVGPKQALARDQVQVAEVNWLTDIVPGQSLPAEVKLRSAQPAAAAQLAARDGACAEITLEVPQFGVAPGQACVFYQGDRVLGGGWIRSAALSRVAA